MIGVITLNPSVDRRYLIDNLKEGTAYRCEDYSFTAGGKGLNVARVINQLGEKVKCLGFLGGFSGKFIKSKLDSLNIENDFSFIKEETRTCLSLLSKDGNQTEILEKGPTISLDEIKDFKEKYIKLLDQVDVIVASGSLPQGLNKDFYKELITLANNKHIKFILDTSGSSLIEGIKAKPFLIKPNQDELSAITRKPINNIDEIIAASSHLINLGAKNIAVSLGKDGMIFISGEKIYKVSVPKIQAVNAVGSGDSTVAGFSFGISKKYNIFDVLRLSNGCGVSNTLQKETGFISLNDLNNIINSITIKYIK
ncbi:1-phosphofructokinase [Clostridium fallax]|uniref:Tagatose-6-phosphate kinase n=1 Tax=Clostridium fallax TaxID=1533 RepID=A0A1M4SV02_9CLOT|nr:1-phosphofructokinase [Clostridium fallax]SHE36012.1 fructose-1-phosphate kinase [Clostridium fallax]SQB07985.1 tagatose-6-phosphate kinase [Clostridium fallax]